MPQQLLWRHVILHTKNTWLHGDARGFRDRDHRLHSSGDYKNPPPPEEHEGLRKWAKARSGEAIKLERELRPLIAEAFAERLMKEGFEVPIVSCSETHVHCLTALPADLPEIKQIIGRCKRNACGAVSRLLPGSIFAEGGKFKIVKDNDYKANVFNYIATEQEPGTFVWISDGREYWMT